MSLRAKPRSDEKGVKKADGEKIDGGKRGKGEMGRVDKVKRESEKDSSV